MTYNNWVYIAVMAAVSYAIRVLPLTLIRKPIKNQFIQSFLYYVPYVTLAVMTFPAIINAPQEPHCRCSRAGSGHRRCMVRSQSVSGVRLLLCRGACAGTVFGALSMKILISGSSGFVGSRVLHQWQGRAELITFPRGSLAAANESAIRRFVETVQPDVILHLAALSDTGYCQQHPEESQRANVELPV